MNSNSRLEVWFGLMAALVLSSCGGRSVLDDERLYGQGSTAGIGGREILPLGSVSLDDPTSPTGGTSTTNFTSTVGVTPTTSVGPTTTPNTSFTIPLPTTGPSTVNPTTVNPTTTVNPGTDVPTTSPTTAPTNDTSSDIPAQPLPALVPFPPQGYAPSIPPGFEGVEWQDPWQCDAAIYTGANYCSSGFSCNGSDYGTANCSLIEGMWVCDCQNNNDYSKMQFAEDAVLQGEACRVAGAMCISAWPDEQGTACAESGDSGSDYCSYSSYCSYEISSDAGIYVNKSTQDYAYCSHSVVNGVDYVSCDCSNSSLGEFAVAWAPESSCLLARDACSAGLDDGSMGEVECMWNSSSSDLYSCTNTDRCLQSATAGGVPVGLLSVQQTYCNLNSDDTWACSCEYYGTDTRLYSASGAREACETAQEDCQAELGSLR